MKVWSKGTFALIVAASSRSRERSIRSILLRISTLGWRSSGSFVEDRLALLVEPLAGVDEQADDVRVAGPAPGGGHHRAVEPALRLEDAGRVDEDDLRLALDGDAAHQRPRRLHLARDDRDLGADERVEQRRLAGIRRADQGDEARRWWPSSSGDAMRFLPPDALAEEKAARRVLFRRALRGAGPQRALDALRPRPST